jgi:general secretion pathway protein K|tara:strand:+ start:693 stop:1547 length:855 start_codon:yes stop_codon:yes gene_type:complete
VLLAAILVVMVASAIIVSITHAEAFSIRKTSRIQVLERANSYAFGLEDWARVLLIRDSKESDTDHLAENWAIGIPGLPIEGGFLSGFLEDEQAKFNINNLLRSEESVKRFQRLCDNLEVETTFIDPLLDWMDEDFDIRYPDGAEDQYETYRVANRPLSDISELMLIKNMTADMYQKLLPHITTLPAPTNINVNTLTDQVFLSLGEGLNLDQYLEEREKEDFKDIPSFIERLQLTIPPTDLSVSTEYFYAHGTVVQGDQSVNFNTLIHRDSNDKTMILNRTLGRL